MKSIYCLRTFFLAGLLAGSLLSAITPGSIVFAQELPPEPVVDGQPPATELPPEPSESQNPAQVPVDDRQVAEGPMVAERQQLYNQIQAAKASGIGIKNYMMAFDYIESMAQRGESEEAIKKRMVPLVSALAGQLKTREEIKTRAASAAVSQSIGAGGAGGGGELLAPGQSIPDKLRMWGGMGGAQTDDLIKRAMQEQGAGGLSGQLPKGLDKNMIREKLKDPRIQEMIRKYQANH